MRRIVNKVLMSVGGWTFLRNAAIFTVAFLVMAYSSAEAKPSKAEFKDALSREIPRHFKLNDFSTEANQNLGNEVDPVWAVRFNATIQTLADLYVHDGTEYNAYFVLRTTKKETKIKVFGKIKSELYQGKWRYYVSFDGNPLSNLGIPLNQYGGVPVIRGSKQEAAIYANLQKELKLRELAEQKQREQERQQQLAQQNREKAKEYLDKGKQTAKEYKYDESIIYYSKAIELDSTFDEAYHSRGQYYLFNKEYDKAINDFINFEKYANDSASKSFANYKIGYVYEVLKKYELVDRYYKKSIEFQPKSYESYNAIAWFYATCEDKKYRDANKAIKYAKEACLMSDWKDPNFMDTLAAAYAGAGNFDDAARMQEKAMNLVKESEKPDFEKRLQMYQNKQAP